MGPDDVKFWWSTATVGFLISMSGGISVYFGFTGLGMIAFWLGWCLVIFSIVMERVTKAIKAAESKQASSEAANSVQVGNVDDDKKKAP